MADERLRRLKLKQQNVAGGHVLQTRADIGCGELGVGAGGDDDRIPTVIVDGDGRPSRRRAAHHVHMLGVDALAGKACADQLSVGVVAGRADNGGCRTGTRRRDGLVRTLAPGSHDDLGAEDGFPGRGNASHANAVVGVEAADDIYVSHGAPRSGR
jgi:hypothetical protein